MLCEGMTSTQERKIKQTGCDARFDNSDAAALRDRCFDLSNRADRRGVSRVAREQASAVIRAAADADLSVIPRGAGTSLVGNAIGEGLVVDFSRYNRQITDLDLEKRSVRVGAGVVLDQLNDFPKTARILFWPGCRNEFARHARRHDR